MSLKTIKEKCTGCGLCYESCPNDAIDFDEDDHPVFNEKCTLCRICIDECPQGALILEGEAKSVAIDLSDYKGVWIFVEQNEKTIPKVVFELLGAGRELALQLNVELAAVLIGDEIKDLPASLFQYGADKVYFVEDERLKDYRTIPFTDVLESLVNKYKPEIILFGATKQGRDLAPRLATRLRTGLTADCTGLDIEEGNLIQTRPAYGGNIIATIKTLRTRPQMATVRSKVFRMPELDPEKEGLLIEEKFELQETDKWTKIIDIIREAKKTANLEDAQIIVSGGARIRKARKF